MSKKKKSFPSSITAEEGQPNSLKVHHFHFRFLSPKKGTHLPVSKKGGTSVSFPIFPTRFQPPKIPCFLTRLPSQIKYHATLTLLFPAQNRTITATHVVRMRTRVCRRWPLGALLVMLELKTDWRGGIRTAQSSGVSERSRSQFVVIGSGRVNN